MMTFRRNSILNQQNLRKLAILIWVYLKSNLILLIKQITITRVLILVVIIALNVWCWYNVLVVFSRYMKYETIIALLSEPPNYAVFPALTICAPSIFTPYKLAGISVCPIYSICKLFILHYQSF